MRKVLALIVVASLVFTLVGCSPSETVEPNGEEQPKGMADFPNRQIRYIVPYAPGGLSDLTARAVEKAVRSEELLDVPFTVTNIDGASAGNGMMEVRDAEADGHTLLHHHTSFIAHELTGVRDWGYEVYTPIAALFEVPGVLVTTPGRYESLQEWIDDVKANPGKTTFGGSSLGGSTHIFAAQVLDQLEIDDKLNYVAYGGGGDLGTALLGGEDNIAAAPLPQMLPYHTNGDLEILAVGSEERLDSIPEVPTLKELGIEIAMPVTQRMGVWAPPETPDHIVDELQEIFRSIVESQTFVDSAEEMGIAIRFGDGKFLRELFDEDKRVMKNIIEDLGI